MSVQNPVVAPEPYVVLVDAEDHPVGVCAKQEVHELGLLHRAVSVFVFNKAGEMLLQQRAQHKYHSGGLWSNAACSHPEPGEQTCAAASRRLMEEMGLNYRVRFAFRFLYRAELGNGLIEHELDHIYFVLTDENPHPAPAEVMGWRWIAEAALAQEAAEHPERFTAWFLMMWKKAFAILTDLSYVG